MTARPLLCAAILTSLWILAPASGMAAEAEPPPAPLAELARDVDRAESLRAIKTLQRMYAQYAQFGLWQAVGALFSDDAEFVFDGRTHAGQQAIRQLLSTRYGAGKDGLPPGQFNTVLVETPLVQLAADGRSARGRWHVLILQASGDQARIEGGIFDNDYARKDGVWRIAKVRYHPQFEGPYETGWTNWGGTDLPVVPYRFTPDDAGVPIPAPTEPAPERPTNRQDLARRIAALNDEDEVRNLQSAYGYYLDRKMWDDVVDLFAADAAYEIGGIGVYRGREGVRKALLRAGPAGLTFGELQDYPQFDTVVTVQPGGREAYARGIELGMLGDATRERAAWEIRVFHNRFVKEDGIWKFREARLFTLIKSDYALGWAKSRLQDAVPTGALAPDSPSPRPEGVPLPVFLSPHPVSGAVPGTVAGAALQAAHTLTGPVDLAPDDCDADLSVLRQRLARAVARDAIVNISTAYSEYLDDFRSEEMGRLFARQGFKVSAFAGYYLGPERISQAARLVFGPPPVTRPGISFHWRLQPVIHLSADARSANLRFRLFQPRTSKEESRPGAFYAAGFHSGYYHDQAVLEDGVWRFWNLSLDEPYFHSVDWKGGWAKAKPRPVGERPRPSPLLGRYDPDVPLAAIGLRAAHFRGGTGDLIEWPAILPMWFHYRNPVSGRVPLHYMPQCVPCIAAPGLALTRHGYQNPMDDAAP